MARKSSHRNLRIDREEKLLYLLLYILFSSFFVYLIKPYYIISILIVLAPPSVVNFLWLKKSRHKILIFTLVSTLLFAPPIELMTRIVNVWNVQSVFPRPFGYIPLENMLFAFINFFWGLSFYEYFIDRDTSKKISKRFKFLVILYLIFSAVIFTLYAINKKIVGMNYFPMSVMILILPSIVIFYKNPKLIAKTILPTAFFAFVFLTYEIISLQIGSWWWPGKYYYTFNINGKILPLDDIIIWYFLSTPALIGGYEFFADDNK